MNRYAGLNERSLLNPLLLTVLVLDQFLKGLALLFLAPAEGVALLPGLRYVSVETAMGVAAPERLRLIVIVLLGALVLVRIQQRDGRGREPRGRSLALLTAGLASNLIDVVLLRQHVGLFKIGFPNAELLLSLADVSVAVGALLLVLELARRPAHPVRPGEVSLPLSEPEPVQVDFSEFNRGIDNVRVDVHLSPRLTTEIRELVTAILAPQIWWEPWRSAEPSPNPRNLEGLRNRYREVCEAAVTRARRERLPAYVALAQLATVRFIREEVHGAYERLLREFRRDLEHDRQRGARTMARLQQHLQSLRRRKASIVEHANDLLLQQLQRVETTAVQEARQSMLGQRAGLPGAWFENPMLRADDTDGDLFLMEHYLLLGHRGDDVTNPARIESLLRDWLDCEANDSGNGLELAGVRQESDPAAREEVCTWFDDPGNADLLLDTARTQQALVRLRRGEPGAGVLRQRLAYQRMLLTRVEQGLRTEGLLGLVFAAYELAAIWPELDLPVNPRVLLRYLADPLQRRRLAPKLQRIDRGEGPVAAKERLDAAVRRLEQMSAGERERRLLRFVRDFLRYRRDLKRLRLMRGWWEQIHLLFDPQQLRLARANRTAYELSVDDDAEGEPQADIAGHVIVKADLRGSTAMTTQLVERGLNPATHFSINFFEPIRSLIDLYGAQKVFVEGDAIILALQDEGVAGEGGSELCVARACGLARSIIEVVSAHNSTGAKYGLPSLELGIGVTYEDGAPTWLFDDEQPIMISSAIARADRLSSCAAFLRRDSAAAGGHRVQVFQAVGSRPVYDKEGVTTFRYNVNGIELEPDAFQKLEQELHLKLLDLPGRQPEGGSERYYRGRYPDARGVMRNLVVREGRIRRYDRRQGPMSETSQSFYEVVVDAQLIARVLESGTASRSGDDL